MLMEAVTTVMTSIATVVMSIGWVNINSMIGIIGCVQGLLCLPGLCNCDQLFLGRHG